MACHKQKDKEYEIEAEYVSDGRNAMWHLSFPFLKPSDIGVKLIDPWYREHEKYTPNDFIVYWDYIVIVVPVGWRIRVWLKPSLDYVLAGLAVHRKDKQILDRHKVTALSTQAYLSECGDGSYDIISDDVDDIDDDVPFPELQNDRRVLVEGDPDVTHVTPDSDCQSKTSAVRDADCNSCCPHRYQSVCSPCNSTCAPQRHVTIAPILNEWRPSKG